MLLDERMVNWPRAPGYIAAAGAAIKKSGYKGPKKYMTPTKQVHIAEGGDGVTDYRKLLSASTSPFLVLP